MTGLPSPEVRERSSRGSARSQLNLLVGDRRAAVFALSVSSVCSGLAEAGIIAVVVQVATALVGGGARVHASIGPFHVTVTIWALLATAAALALIRLALQAPISFLPAKIASDVQARLRRDLFAAFTRASWDMQSRDREGHLQEMMTSQVVQATQAAMQTGTLVTALFTFIALIASALVLNVVGAAVVLTAAILLFGLLRPLNVFGYRRARALSQAQMEYAGAVGEAIRVTEETRVFGVAAAQRERIDRFVGSARGLFFRTLLVSRLTPNIYQSLMFLVIIGGLAGLHAAGATHLVSLGAVVFLLVRAGTYGQQLQSSYQLVRQALPFVERLQEAERRYASSSPSTGRRPLPGVRTLAFDHVSYAYRPGRPVLSDISFEVTRGEAIGVIGPSGAGKSTLVQILLQLRVPEHGRYLVNGLPAEEYAPEDWQRLIAYVPQDPRLVHASVADNIRFFRDIDDAAVQEAGRLARIHDDVMGWSNGYDTIIGPRADAVSGGQQQRICLARALAARPEVLVLDEPTSALDPRSEALIQDSLTALKDELTMFIIAHRMSTLDMCGRVMVIVEGRLEAFETTVSLRRNNSYYRSASTLAAGSSARGSH
jgi:ATP-binding cassette subfamily B protein